MPFKDKSGTVLRPGDYVVCAYDPGGSNSARLRYGIVLAVMSSSPTKGSALVHCVDDAYGTPELTRRPSRLSFGSRMLKVDGFQIPTDVLDILRMVEVL